MRKFERFMAWKHLTRRRKTGFISLISLISITGVGVGVMALIVVLSVMSGFDQELKSKIVNVQPHLRIERMGGVTDYLKDIETITTLKIPNITAAAPFIEGQAILRSPSNATGVVIKGIDPQREDLSIYRGHLVSGDIQFEDTVYTQKIKKWGLFSEVTEHRLGSIYIGENLAMMLRVHVGDEISLVSPFQGSGKMTLRNSQNHRFIVKGIFKLGMSDFDSSLALVSLSRAQGVFGLGNRVTGIGIRFLDVDDAQKMKPLVMSQFPANYFIRSWYDMNENFFQALKVEKSVMTILLALIILVAAFNIISTLIMVVMEKTKDIGLLRAIGATRASIKRIFIYEGFSVGFIGIIMGAVSGTLIALNLNTISEFLKETTGFEVFPSDIYYFDRIPVQVHPEDVSVVVIFALIAAVLAGWYPSHRAANLDPVEALRYE